MFAMTISTSAPEQTLNIRMTAMGSSQDQVIRRGVPEIGVFCHSCSFFLYSSKRRHRDTYLYALREYRIVVLSLERSNPYIRIARFLEIVSIALNQMARYE